MNLQSLIHKRAIQHLGFWIISALVLLRIFSDGNMWSRTNIIYTALFQLSIIPAVYINLLSLMPRFWNRYKWLPYLGMLVILILGSVVWNDFIFNVLVDFIFPGYYFISYYSWIEISQFVLVFLIITTLLKLSRAWFELQNTQRRLERMEHSQRAFELISLKEQLNPHFLFNGLHSIYSLTIENNRRAPDFILKLSDVLRFVLYETNSSSIRVEKELDCIREYLEIQKLRLPEDADIRMECRSSGEAEFKIAPLLLLPLVENSFKHGLMEAGKRTFVHVDSLLSEQQYMFSIKNSLPDEQQKKESGIGLQNLQRRLQLLYPGKHELNIAIESSAFQVTLTISN